jgi:hypothetical protein
MAPIIIIKEMANYSAMKSHLAKNNPLYFTSSPNSEKRYKLSKQLHDLHIDVALLSRDTSQTP